MFLEHVNMSVANLERSIEFYGKVLGLKVRWRGLTSTGEQAAHLGTERCYLAMFEAGSQGGTGTPDYSRVGPNHFGWVVEDLAAVKRRLSELGVTPHLEPDYEPGNRLYFYDPDGMEVELVQYSQNTSIAKV